MAQQANGKSEKKRKQPAVGSKKKDRSLPERKRQFCQFYALYLCKTTAAEKAGYAKKTAGSKGHSLYNEPEVRAEIDRLMKERAERTGITTDYVVNSLKEVADRCMQTVPVLDKKGEQEYTENAEGKIVPAYTFNSMGANKSLELIGKHLGMFVEQKDISVSLTLAGLAQELEGEDEE